MGFWIFMLIMNLLIPLTMIILGKKYRDNPPQNRKGLSGYRSGRSIKNQDTWIFSQKLFGKFWFLEGIIILIPSVTAMIFIYGKAIDKISLIGGMITALQGVVMILPTYFFIEQALKKNFDKDGNRIEK